MGVCTSDPLNYLINQYGNDDVCKFVVAEKTEEIIEDIAPKIKKRAKQQIDNSTKEIHKSIEQSDKKINDNFRSTVEDIDKLDPKAISTASKIQGKSTQQILGLNSMRSQVGKIKRNADKKINNQSETIMKQIDEQKNKE